MHLHGYWKNAAVIQQNRSYDVAGWDPSADRVTAILFRQSDGEELYRGESVIQDGCFSVVMPPMKGSFQTYRLEVIGSAKQTLTDLCFGEVWITAGQSNMEFVLGNTLDREMAESRYSPWIRYFRCEKPEDALAPTTTDRETVPQGQLMGGPWQTADNAENACGMSAVAFYLASVLLEEVQVPIGMVNTAMGGTTIEAWLSRRCIEQNTAVKAHLQAQGRYLELHEMNTLGERNYTQMTGLFNERIAPLFGIPFRAVAWLQGESSAADPAETDFYREALRVLIDGWRGGLGQETPFFLMHIAAENYQFSQLAVPRLNEAISMVAEELGKVWAVPVYDLPLDWVFADRPGGHPIHPSRKYPYGMRLAKLALYQIYGIGAPAQAPAMRQIDADGSRLLVRFAPVGEGLRCTGQRLAGFTLCGRNGIHLEADAQIINEDTVAVFHPAIGDPVGVSYGFALYNQSANLVGCGDLPALPFRKDTLSAPVYTEPREWLWCDRLNVFQTCFEPALGGAGSVPLWKAGSFGTAGTLRCQDGVAWDYKTEKTLDSYVSIATNLQLAGRFHNLETVDTMSVTIHNPDGWEKRFVGPLIQTVRGKRYYLPILFGRERKHSQPLPPHSTTTYTVDLKSFLGCYLLPERKEPADLSDVIALEFVFQDLQTQTGRLHLTDLKLGFGTPDDRK